MLVPALCKAGAEVCKTTVSPIDNHHMIIQSNGEVVVIDFSDECTIQLLNPNDPLIADMLKMCHFTVGNL